MLFCTYIHFARAFKGRGKEVKRNFAVLTISLLFVFITAGTCHAATKKNAKGTVKQETPPAAPQAAAAAAAVTDPEAPAASESKMTLGNAIKRVLNYNGEVLSERKGMDFAQGRIDQARAGWYPKTTLYLLAAPIFEERGNAVQSRKDYTKWGIFGDAMIEIVQPLYTFGMLSSYKDAAQHGYEVETQKAKEEEIVYRLKQFYYGYQLANDLVDIAQEAKDKLDSTMKTAERLLEQNKIKREDLFTIKTYYAQMLTKHDEALRGKDLAKKALIWTLGYTPDTEIELEDEYLNPETFDIKTEADYLVSTTDNRPELKMLYSGIEATRSLWEAQYKQKRPVFFLTGFGNAAYSNVREKQSSTFANDRFNGLSGAAIFGFKFNLDWWTINAMSKQSKAEYEKLLTVKETLQDGMMLQVKKAYREVTDLKRAIGYTKDGEDNASKWIINAMMGYSIGSTQAKDLMDAMKAYFEAKINYCMAIYNYNMALADLSKNTGKEVVPSLKY
jgi:outer membrane protein